MQRLENLVLTSERLLLNVLNLIIYIRSKLEVKVNMEGYAGKHRVYFKFLANRVGYNIIK